jgi:hypothetical protein
VVMCPAMASTSAGLMTATSTERLAVQVERTDPVEPVAQRDRDYATHRGLHD